jgi:hypothetical protein
MDAEDPTTYIWARLIAGDWPGARAAGPQWRGSGGAHHPTIPTHAGAALDAMVAALPRRAKRQLRAACRAGRAAVDSRATALAVPRGASAAGLSAAVARMPRLRSLDCCMESKAGCAELAGALGAAPASLAALTYVEAHQPASAAGAGPPWALADAVAPRLGLADLDLQLSSSLGLCDAFVAAVGALPQLRTLRLSVSLGRGDADPWREAPPVLALPSTLQASAVGF